MNYLFLNTVIQLVKCWKMSQTCGFESSEVAVMVEEEVEDVESVLVELSGVVAVVDGILLLIREFFVEFRNEDKPIRIYDVTSVKRQV